MDMMSIVIVLSLLILFGFWANKKIRARKFYKSQRKYDLSRARYWQEHVVDEGYMQYGNLELYRDLLAKTIGFCALSTWNQEYFKIYVDRGSRLEEIKVGLKCVTKELVTIDVLIGGEMALSYSATQEREDRDSLRLFIRSVQIHDEELTTKLRNEYKYCMTPRGFWLSGVRVMST